MSLHPDDVIDGKYRIVRLLGEGGMGAVYEGENTLIHRRVAIKVLHGHVAKNADAAQRFEREAQAAGRIGSEHIVEVLDLGMLPDGARYMVMEFLDGESLSQRIRSRGRLTPEELWPIAAQMLDALTAAHGAGIVHRDLKPDNVFLLKNRGGRTDFVKLLDFGISKFNRLNKDSGFSMTRTGAVMGTPFYMAPEQAKGARNLDHRVDLYSAGVMLYEALSGRVPFQAETFNELLFKIALESPTPLEQVVPDIDPGFAAIVSRAMAREPDQRFQSAAEFRSAIDVWGSAGPPTMSVPPLARSGMAQLSSSRLGRTGSAIAITPAPDAQAGAPPRTEGAWTNSPNQGSAKKSHMALFVALGALLLVTLAGGGVVWKIRHDSQVAAAAEQRAAEEREKNERRAAEERERLERERVAAERARAEAAQMREEAERAQAAANAAKQTKGADEAKRAADEKARQAAAAEAKAAAAGAQVARTEAAVTRQPAKRVETKAQPTATATAGRRIRTEL